ncbi:hypothetical protein ACFL0U_03095 [Pseudomonadota bacterium]
MKESYGESYCRLNRANKTDILYFINYLENGKRELDIYFSARRQNKSTQFSKITQEKTSIIARN